MTQRKGTRALERIASMLAEAYDYEVCPDCGHGVDGHDLRGQSGTGLGFGCDECNEAAQLGQYAPCVETIVPEGVVTAAIEAAGRTIIGTYSGGPYIELHFGSASEPGFEVINVWDYVTDKPTIDRTSRAVKAAMVDWRTEAGDSLEHDLREAALFADWSKR